MSSQIDSAATIPQDGPVKTEEELRGWLEAYTGLKLPEKSVCPGHHSPWEIFKTIHLDRPSVALVLGSRGSGKSFLSALDTHLTSRWDPKHGTRILGGSKQQSAQIYEALQAIVTDHDGTAGNDSAAIAQLRKEKAAYANGSRVEILAASSRSVRGPHVPSLKLDEVDEIDTEIREAAMGMCMGRLKRGEKREAMTASVLMTSTCHRVNGPMAHLVDRAEKGEFPLFTMCAFEVLERCPDERSGEDCEKCSECPLMRYCHDVPEGELPKAKRSDGHYPIESLIQKFRTTSQRVFEADYLCKLSGSDAAWFPSFSAEAHVSEEAECRAGSDVHIAVDSGVFTGAVLFQIVEVQAEGGKVDQVRVFADYLAEGQGAAQNATAIRKIIRQRCEWHRQHLTTDPAGRSRTSIGPTVLAEYTRVGLEFQPWPLCRVADSLALLDSFINPADKSVAQLLVHPRCTHLIAALQNYRRAKRGGQLLDVPADPQHPYEDLVDALRGGLKAHYPNGRIPAQKPLTRVSASKVF